MHVFLEKMETLERGSNDLLKYMGDLVVESNKLQEESQVLNRLK